MSIVLTTLNSKFIHSNLAIRYLKEYVKDFKEVYLMEFTINQDLAEIASNLYLKDADLIGFSTYIWNIDQTLEICERLKIVNPNIKLLLGGPEVSFDMEVFLKDHSHIDYVIYGEGEETFKELVMGSSPENIRGLAYRRGEHVRVNPPRPLIEDLDRIRSPYENIGDEFKNKIAYYESSRGCPFNCAFCLSSTIKGVRYMGIERVKRDLDNLIEGGVRQVKFVDRTFNADREFSREIMEHIVKKDPEGVNFHFEVTAHLVDKDQLDFFKTIKEGLFQFEIGVQSTNPKTIHAIGRSTDLDKLSEVTTSIRHSRNIHQHLDLIAGLPYEDYRRFGQSFDHLFLLRPEKIQLGFLKLLKGSRLRNKMDEYGYILLDKAPYEILKSKWLSYDDLIVLKRIEELVEKYYNEQYFQHSLEYMIKNRFNGAFHFFEEFSKYWSVNCFFEVSHSRDALYRIINEYSRYKVGGKDLVFEDLLRYDYLLSNGGKPLPEFLGKEASNSSLNIHGILKSDDIINDFLPQHSGLPTKKLMKKVNILRFSYNPFDLTNDGYSSDVGKNDTVVLFHYMDQKINRCNSYDITEYAKELVE